jgi:tRNA(fMet)-specific endonuclease VapC
MKATEFDKRIGLRLSMILLDSDHLSMLKYSKTSTFSRLAGRMADSVDQDFATTAISVEEQFRGWLAQINRTNDVAKQVLTYRELVGLIEFFGFWKIADFDERAADQFKNFRRLKMRGGTMDLKIAAIAVTQDALLLTANTQDFEKVPGLRIENWLR